VATPTVVKKIIRLKEENSGLFAWEIREQLQQQRICDPSSVPSISSINRILRNSGLWTDEMTSNQQNAAAVAAASAGHSATTTAYTAATNQLYNNATNSTSTTDPLAYAHAHSRATLSQSALGFSNAYRYADTSSVPPTSNSQQQQQQATGSASSEHPIKPSPKHPLAPLPAGSANAPPTTLNTPLTAQDLSYSAALQKHWF
ncbi:hypothetical protein DOY81_014453, partial [Sarcophaga bullata]